MMKVEPFILCEKEINVLTAGTPADIAEIDLPEGLGRFITTLGFGPGLRLHAETGDATGAVFILRDSLAGLGQPMTLVQSGPSATGTNTTGSGLATPSSSKKLVIRQTADSSNPCVLSAYVTVVPLP
jgi:hypothetical protein